MLSDRRLTNVKNGAPLDIIRVSAVSGILPQPGLRYVTDLFHSSRRGRRNKDLERRLKMSKKTPVILPRAIQDLVEKIETTAQKSDDHTIELAKHLCELRGLIEAGAVGEVKWYAWVSENVRLQKSQLCVLMRIAEAPDSRAEAVRQREMNARRQANYRARQATLSDLAPECHEIIKWARKASVSDARAILRIIDTRSNLSISA
jgi:hypothetical protein